MTASATSRLVAARGLTIGYGATPILKDVAFDISGGDYVGIIGPNGGGKTTLLRTLLGLIPPLEGSIVVKPPDGGAVARLGYVPQHETFDSLYPFSALQVALMGRYRLVGVGRRVGAEHHRQAQAALLRLGVADLAHHPFRDLSGGQKQRVLIARALACEPHLLILDEPTSSMDIRGEREVMELLERLRVDRGVAIVIVSHFLANLRDRVKRVLVCDRENRGFQVGDPDTFLRPESIGLIFSGRPEESLPPAEGVP